MRYKSYFVRFQRPGKQLLWTFTTVLFGLLQGVQAQQLPQSSLFWLNPAQFHSAAVGTESVLVGVGSYRKQWSQFAGAPETQALNVHAPIARLNSGVGLRIQNDLIGAHRITSADFLYRYRLFQMRALQVNIGAGVGYHQYRLDGAALRAPDGTYNEQTGVLVHNDNNLPESGLQTGAISTEVGLWLQSEKTEVGVTLLPAYARPFTYNDVAQLTVQRPAHLHVYGSYIIPVGSLSVQPSLMIHSDLIKTQTNIACKVQFSDQIFGSIGVRGLGTSNVESMTFGLGGRVNPNLILAYAFDSVLSPLKAASTGSHELVIRYTMTKSLGAGKLPPIIFNPRFL